MQRREPQDGRPTSHSGARKVLSSATRGDLVKLTHDAYTVMWICALHIEMAAAKAVLDHIHEPLPISVDDNNTYVLGSIWGHNIVIACLPDAEYGTISAALVVSDIKRSFQYISAGLVVGIGGGVPSRTADVRLGDVVVGTRIMQYDLGKAVGAGELTITATPRLPHARLRTAVSALRSRHELDPSRVPAILGEMFRGKAEYGRPSSPDYLFLASHDHPPNHEDCAGCDHSKLVLRRKRASDDPVVHYGVIASGNQVMKSAIRRDEIGIKLSAICFEMEAAGLMGSIPCLPIRGICDYCDSHKSKGWQRYAAAAAAAYARELLEVLPFVDGRARAAYLDASLPTGGDSLSQKDIKLRLDSLKFARIHARLSTLKPAHAQTCRWLIGHEDYQAWLDPRNIEYNNGFLWISGKPGVGKSTIMKFAFSAMQKELSGRKDAIVTSFFFNARGEYLERSISGMYRSLLLQLLESYPDTQVVLESPALNYFDNDLGERNWNSIYVLKDVFADAVSLLGRRSFTCFIDALDECDEQQVLEMVEYFEELAQEAAGRKILLRVCFSSRHYPYISIKKGRRFALEAQPGHAEDLTSYVENRLLVNDQSLINDLLGKASGIFLWVVLVVEILNGEYRRGRPALRTKLMELPVGLSALLNDLLARDDGNVEDFRLCVLWILLAKRPLRPDELYHAIWTGLAQHRLADPDVPDMTAETTHESIHRFVTSSSKGLAEITDSSQPTVQFIHETVRDFLTHDQGMHKLWPGLDFSSFDWESHGHEALKHICNSYLGYATSRTSLRNRDADEISLTLQYPFLRYAHGNVLHHADSAGSKIPQQDFMRGFDFQKWLLMRSSVSVNPSLFEITIFYVLAENGYAELIRAKRLEFSSIHVRGGEYEYPLFAAIAGGHREAALALLGVSSASGTSRLHRAARLEEWNTLGEFKGRTPLSWAAQQGRPVTVELLLRSGANIDELDWTGRTPLSRALTCGRIDVATLLVRKGADVRARNKDGQTALHVIPSDAGIARLLLDKGADVNALDVDEWSPLRVASLNESWEVARLLIDAGADIDQWHDWSTTSMAQGYGMEEVAGLIIGRVPDSASSRDNGWPTVQRASYAAQYVDDGHGNYRQTACPVPTDSAPMEVQCLHAPDVGKSTARGVPTYDVGEDVSRGVPFAADHNGAGRMSPDPEHLRELLRRRMEEFADLCGEDIAIITRNRKTKQSRIMRCSTDPDWLWG